MSSFSIIQKKKRRKKWKIPRKKGTKIKKPEETKPNTTTKSSKPGCSGVCPTAEYLRPCNFSS